MSSHSHSKYGEIGFVFVFLQFVDLNVWAISDKYNYAACWLHLHT